MRIRTIKPEFWSSPTVTKLPRDTRLTFIGLWNYADDDGRGRADPRLIKAAIWPVDDDITASVVSTMLNDLQALGLITIYEFNSAWFLQINSWAEHQRISRPTPSRLPEPSLSPPRLFTAGREQGREGNREQGREGNGVEAAASPADDAGPETRPLHPTQPSEDQIYLGDRLGLSAKAIQRLNTEYGRVFVTDSMRSLHGFPPEGGVENAYAWIRTACSLKAASA